MLDHAGAHDDSPHGLATAAWLRDVIAEASTLAERRAPGWSPLPTDADVVQDRVERWMERVADGDRDRWTQRLRFDGMDAATARSLVGRMVPPPGAALPGWATLLAAVSERMSTTATVEPMSAEHRIAFEEILADFACEGQQRLRARTGAAYARLVPAAHEQLRRTLVTTLAWLSGQTLALEFRLFRDRRESRLSRLARRAAGQHSDRLYRAFVAHQRADGLRTLGREYASLVRLLADVTRMWIDTTAELILRLDADADAIRDELLGGREPGAVRWVINGVSDRHMHGRGVAIIVFESGARVVYKPKPMVLEDAWYRFVDAVALPGGAQTLRVLTRTGYGWVQFAHGSPVRSDAEVRAYYGRIGEQLALLHVLAATDCHYENVVAVGAYPVLVDAETVLHHSRARTELPAGFDAQVAAVRRLDTSVLRPGLLPQWSEIPGGGSDDKSGLGEDGDDLTRREFATYDGIGSDDLQLRPRRLARAARTNVPLRDGQRTSVLEHQEEFVAGFVRGMQHVMARRDDIDARLQRFAGMRSRFIFRATQVYADLIEDGNHPDLMRSGVDRSLHFEALYRQRELRDAPPAWWPLIAAEHAALSRLDVPVFFARVDDDVLVADDGTEARGVLREPSLAFVRARLQSLDEAEIAEQTELVRGCLYSKHIERARPEAGAPAEGLSLEVVPPVGDALFVAEAVRIGEQLAAAAVRGADGSATWIGLEPLPGTGRFNLQPVSASLYGGSAGIGLFFAALHRTTGQARWAELARGSVAHVIADAHSGGREHIVTAAHGGVCGIGSLAYAWSQMADHTGDVAYLDAALAATRRLDDELVQRDQVFDVCAGTAGTLLGTLALWRRTQDERLLQLARACGEHLLASRVVEPRTGLRGWTTIEGHPLTGMSHGSAGIAMALARLGDVTGVARFRDAAAEALAFEQAVYVPQTENWPDFRDHDEAVGHTCMTAWCHGAPGIGIARAAMLRTHRHVVAEDLDIAARTTRRLGLGACDNLCCGNFGRVDALLTMGRAAGRRDCIEEARSLATAAVVHAAGRGGYDLLPGVPRGTVVPGFFTGLAGIGYVLARLTAPECFGSVLGWEDGDA